ncbi:helix-turn-helix domain-containing protein [Spirosoma linguale]|uniref:Transcriptional regulator, AraC family n=1 Tax=Spirosoma linguale (strain ATCC 33905 / DSM 74 / LMG 10896 / Claus 1) TaxID=504472 RepID=D2QC47_SPILD|nr:transcriptional regulator, AraC family [Spirosoma linguale DSM 74]
MDTIPVRQGHTDTSNSADLGPIIVRRLEELLAGEDMVQPLHRHSFYFILVIEKGSGRHTIDFTSHPIVDGTIFIIRPGQVHELTVTKDSKGFLVQIFDEFYVHTDKLAKQTLKNVSRTNFYRTGDEHVDRIRTFLDTMVREIFEKRPYYEQAIQLTLHLLFIDLLRQQKSASINSGSASTYNQQQLELFQDLIANHFADQKQLSWYARQLHLSVYQLNAVAKATLDKTGSTLINEYILLEAKRYLLATANQINLIAWHLGYEDVSYFIRFFKKHTGYSPEAFRMKFK